MSSVSPVPPRYLAQYGNRLISNGYQIVPIAPGDKFPKGLKHWQNIQATPQILEQWLAQGHAHDGVGVLTTHTPAVDIDVYNKAASDAMAAWIDEYIGIGKLRVGEAPKQLLVFRTDTPFEKVFSSTYKDNHGKLNRVEILGTGQQFVAYAIHPDVLTPYEWINGDILDTPSLLLDTLSRQQAVSICVAFEQLAATVPDWQLIRPGNWQSSSTTNQLSSGIDPLDVKLPLPDVGIEEARQLIFAPPVVDIANASNDEWVRVGQALHHQFDGSYEAFDLWDEWSSSGATYEGTDATKRRWDSFGRRNLSDRAITLRTYEKQHRDYVAAQSSKALTEIKENEAFLLDGLRNSISTFGGDWFDYRDSDVARKCKYFLEHSTDPDRHEAALLAALKLRKFESVGSVTDLKKSLKVVKRNNVNNGSIIAAVTPTAAIAATNYEMDKEGRYILPTQSNVEIAMRSGLLGQIAHDEFKADTLICSPGSTVWRRLTDNDYARALILLEQQGFNGLPKDKVKDGFALFAEERAIDSAILWANSLVWDGVPRLGTFGQRYLHLPATPYITACWNYVWTAMAGRLLCPGLKVDMVPILISGEGQRKSTFVEALAPIADSFAMLDMSKKEDDISRAMKGVLVMEWAELKGLKGRDEETIKAFVTQTFQEWTPKYKEMSVRFARRCFFIGTANDKTPLPRHGAARRWLPMTLDRAIDVEGVRNVLEQLWAEAVATFKTYGVLWQQAQDLAPAERDAYREEDELAQFVEAWLRAPSFSDTRLTNADVPFRIADLIAALESSGRRNLTARRLGPVLHDLGLNNKARYYVDIGTMDRRWFRDKNA